MQFNGFIFQLHHPFQLEGLRLKDNLASACSCECVCSAKILELELDSGIKLMYSETSLWRALQAGWLIYVLIVSGLLPCWAFEQHSWNLVLIPHPVIIPFFVRCMLQATYLIKNIHCYVLIWFNSYYNIVCVAMIIQISYLEFLLDT